MNESCLHKKIAEHEVRLPDAATAKLLGISLEEYHTLSHWPLEEFKDIYGNIVEYSMHISPNDDPAILDKLKIDKSNYMRLNLVEVRRHYV